MYYTIKENESQINIIYIHTYNISSLKEMKNPASGFHQVLFDKENHGLFWNMVSPIGGGILN